MSYRLLLYFGKYTGVYCISLLFVCLRHKFTKHWTNFVAHCSSPSNKRRVIAMITESSAYVRTRAYVLRRKNVPKATDADWRKLKNERKYKSGWIVRHLCFAWQDWLAYDFYVQNLDGTLREHTLMLTYQRCELRFIYLHHLLFEWELICHYTHNSREDVGIYVGCSLATNFLQLWVATLWQSSGGKTGYGSVHQTEGRTDL